MKLGQSLTWFEKRMEYCWVELGRRFIRARVVHIDEQTGDLFVEKVVESAATCKEVMRRNTIVLLFSGGKRNALTYLVEDRKRMPHRCPSMIMNAIQNILLHEKHLRLRTGQRSVGWSGGECEVKQCDRLLPMHIHQENRCGQATTLASGKSCWEYA